MTRSAESRAVGTDRQHRRDVLELLNAYRSAGDGPTAGLARVDELARIPADVHVANPFESLAKRLVTHHPAEPAPTRRLTVAELGLEAMRRSDAADAAARIFAHAAAVRRRWNARIDAELAGHLGHRGAVLVTLTNDLGAPRRAEVRCTPCDTKVIIEAEE